jgi:hypothetical protein
MRYWRVVVYARAEECDLSLRTYRPLVMVKDFAMPEGPPELQDVVCEAFGGWGRFDHADWWEVPVVRYGGWIPMDDIKTALGYARELNALYVAGVVPDLALKVDVDLRQKAALYRLETVAAFGSSLMGPGSRQEYIQRAACGVPTEPVTSPVDLRSLLPSTEEMAAYYKAREPGGVVAPSALRCCELRGMHTPDATGKHCVHCGALRGERAPQGSSPLRFATELQQQEEKDKMLRTLQQPPQDKK